MHGSMNIKSLFNLRLPTQKKYRNIHFKRSLILGCHVLIEFPNRISRGMSLNPTDLSIYLPKEYPYFTTYSHSPGRMVLTGPNIQLVPTLS